MATMAKPNALAIPNRSIAPGPDPMLPTTAAPQPKNTRAKVPTNSAACLFIPCPLHDPAPQAADGAYNDRSGFGKGQASAVRRAEAASSGRAALLSWGPRIYKRRPFNDALMNGAAFASP